jgi:hypothetical protein
MNDNSKVLKKILFSLQKSDYGLECKLVIWDCFQTTSQEETGSLPSSLFDKPDLSRLGWSTAKPGWAVHWDAQSPDMNTIFELNKADNHKTKNKIAEKKKKHMLCSGFYFKTFTLSSMTSSPTTQRH